MSSGWGGAWGGSQGGREFSPTASLTKLPRFTSDNAGQGGRTPDRSDPPKPPKTGDSQGPEGTPSPPESAGERPHLGSPSVATVVGGVDREKIEVRVPTQPPPLTPPVCRELLAILIELTAVEILDVSTRRGRNDC